MCLDITTNVKAFTVYAISTKCIKVNKMETIIKIFKILKFLTLHAKNQIISQLLLRFVII